MATVPEAAGANCADGGIAIESGLDNNGDGVLEPTEVTSTSYVCGTNQLVRVDPEPSGSNCADGGSAIHTGLDANGDGILEDDEIESTTYACNVVPSPVVVTGDVIIHNSYEAAQYAGTVTINGQLIIDSNALFAVTFPSLQSVNNVTCTSPCALGNLSLPSLQHGVLTLDAPLTELDVPSLQTGELHLQSTELSALQLPSFGSGYIAVYDDQQIVSISAPELSEGSVDVHALPSLTGLDLPSFQGASVTVYNSTNVTSVLLPAMQSGTIALQWDDGLGQLTASSFANGDLYVFGGALISLELPVMAQGTISVDTVSTLGSITAPMFADGELTITDNNVLANVSFPAFTDATTFVIRDNPALPACQVEALAAQANATNTIIENNDDVATCP